MELMGDYNSGDPVTSGEAYARFENPTKLVKYLRDELKADLRDDNKVDRPIRFETEIRPALLGRFEYTIQHAVLPLLAGTPQLSQSWE